MRSRLQWTSVLLAIGLVALLGGLASLQRTFWRERDAALESLDDSRRTLLSYATRALEELVKGELRRAEEQVERALADPRVAAGHLLSLRAGEQRLPRQFRFRDTEGDPATDALFEQLQSVEGLERQANGGSPWAERCRLLQTLRAAVAADDRDATGRAFQSLLSHRLHYRIDARLDLTFALALLDEFERTADPHPDLLRMFLRDGLTGKDGAELVGLQTELLRKRSRFSRREFDFLASRLADLAERTSVPYADFVARVEEEDGAVLAWPEFGEVGMSLWSVRTPAARNAEWAVDWQGGGRLDGVRIDVEELLRRVDAEMHERALLRSDEHLWLPSNPGGVVSIADLGFDLVSSRWVDGERQIRGTDRLKTSWLVACAVLAVVMAGLALALQVRRFRLIELQSSFVSTVSHELRTPVASIRLLAETLQRRLRGDDRARDYPERIVRTADDLSVLVDNILSFNRLDERGVRLEVRPVRLAELVEQVRADVEEWSSKPIEVSVEVDPELTFNADAELLRTLLLNLARNSCLYHSRGTVQLTLAAVRRQGTLVLSVGDNGDGFLPEDAARAFQKFYRAPDRGEGRPPGTGLGLAICKTIADLHGATIEIVQTSPAGTTIEVVLPVRGGAVDG